jgi:transaldolase
LLVVERHVNLGSVGGEPLDRRRAAAHEAQADVVAFFYGKIAATGSTKTVLRSETELGLEFVQRLARHATTEEAFCVSTARAAVAVASPSTSAVLEGFLVDCQDLNLDFLRKFL